MYGEGRNWRVFVGLGLVIVLLFVIIFMIVRSGGSDSKVPETKRELTSYANDPNITITQTMIGAIVAPQNHSEVQISINNNSATVDVIRGYDGNVVSSRTYPLSTAAFSEFLGALERAGFTNGNTDEALRDDSGHCPTGERYIYEIRDGSNSIQRFWTTTCNDVKTYKGNLGLTQELFYSQIPDYDAIVDEAEATGRNNGLFN